MIDQTIQDHPATTRYRWAICGLLFMATGINYVDRQMIGLLKPTLQLEFGWSEGAYANIVFWFQAAYALGYISFGAIIDRLGAKFGYAAAFTLWTFAHILHGVVHSILGFGAVRFLLGIGESGSFPAGLKAVATWFPAEERALAVGIFNAGANIGAIVTPLAIPAITLAFGWRMAFFITGGVSLFWLVAWLLLYRRSPRDDRSLARPTMPWRRVIHMRQTWAYASAKFLTDPIWWLFLFWLPDYLHRQHGLQLKEFGLPLMAIYLLSDVGSVCGGWLSSRLLQKGFSVNRARKLVMLLCALGVTPILTLPLITSLWPAVAIIGLAAACHQAWSANLFTLPSDTVPQAMMGSVVGIGGTAGAVGGMIMAEYTGLILDRLGVYWPIFAIAGSVYLLALAMIQVILPDLQMADGGDGATMPLVT